MQLTNRLGTYIMHNPDDAKLLASYGWNACKDGTMRTSQIVCAAPFFMYALDYSIRLKLEARWEELEREVYDSRALDADFEVPLPKGEEARPYQKAGVKYMLSRERVLLADSMRLGKTLQAIGVGNVNDIQTSLTVPPATAKVNWQRALMRFKTFGGDVGIAYGDEWPNTPHVICNYDILSRHVERIADTEYDQANLDEAHKLRNFTSARTRLILGDGKKAKGILKAKKTIFITGTPVFTRTKDLWPIVNACDPQGLGKKERDFKIRYCGAQINADGWIEDDSGSSNLLELQRLMRQRFMVRREKKDVVGEVKEIRDTIVIPNDEYRSLVRAEREAAGDGANLVNRMFAAAQNGDDLSSYFDDLSHSMLSSALEEGQLSTIRKELALLKVPTVVEVVNRLIVEGEKVVVFAHHRDVVAKLRLAFPDAAVLIGGMTPKQKDAAEQRFQTDPACRVFIGNIEAAGQAIRLDAANTVVYAEISWSPGDMEQTEDRVWDVLKDALISIIRIVIEGTLDEQMGYVVDARIKDKRQAVEYRGIE